MFFWKIRFLQNVTFLKRLMLCRSTCFKKVARFKHLCSNSSSEKIAVPKSKCHKSFLFSRSDCSVEVSLRKRNYSEKITLAKKWLIWKRRKKQLFWKNSLPRKSNCVEVVTLKKCEEVTSPKMKFFSKIGNKCEKGNHYF